MTTNQTMLSRIMHGLISAMERTAERRARDHLLRLGDAHLSDLGLSRDLVEQGPQAWPWREQGEQAAVTRITSAKRDVNDSHHVPSSPVDYDSKIAA